MLAQIFWLYHHRLTKSCQEDSEGLVVTGINSTSNKKHDLIRVYLNSKECPVKNVKCYVLPSLIDYELNKTELSQMIKECKNIRGFKDPFNQEADHKEGISIVLGPGAMHHPYGMENIQ